MALLVDPRFPGGTGTAVAAEIRALAPHVDLAVYGLKSAMFRDRSPNPAIVDALDEVGQRLLEEPQVVHADTIVFHNPACLKFDSFLKPRLSARRTLVVTHENFLRPGGSQGFDVGHCLGLIADRVVGGELLLAPVSPGNRHGVATWLGHGTDPRWRLAPDDWSNICDEPLLAPTPTPRDRRGRHSRPGFEKFPPLETLQRQFPPHADRCSILGADTLLLDPESLPSHWQLLPFGSIKVADFLAGIDFFVYFTHPLWRESFGRAIAEAIAAGKLVITDAATAENFGPGVIVDDGSQIDLVIREHVASPGRYGAAVRRAQAGLAAYSADRVVTRLLALLEPKMAVNDLL